MSVDLRRAKAGLLRLEGKSRFRSLTEAGFADSTAASPKRNGLTDDVLLAEAQKLGVVPQSAELASKARQVLNRKLDQLRDDDQQLEKARCGEVARIVEVTEKFHGGHGNPGEITPELLGDRMAYVEAVAKEYRRRKAEYRQQSEAGEGDG